MRGTCAALADPRFIEHLQRLGVTAVELLPVHAHLDEPHLTASGLSNHWGYNTLSFFAPHGPVAEWFDLVTDDGVVAHGEGAASGGIFFTDPDGIRLEIYAPGGAESAPAPSGAAPTCGFF